MLRILSRHPDSKEDADASLWRSLGLCEFPNFISFLPFHKPHHLCCPVSDFSSFYPVSLFHQFTSSFCVQHSTLYLTRPIPTRWYRQSVSVPNSLVWKMLSRDLISPTLAWILLPHRISILDVLFGTWWHALRLSRGTISRSVRGHEISLTISHDECYDHKVAHKEFDPDVLSQRWRNS